MSERHVELSELEGVYILRLRGNQDMDHADSLREVLVELAETEGTNIVIDMTETNSISPAISTEIIECSRRLSKNNNKLRMVGVPTETRQMLDVLNADENLVLFQELTGALLSFPSTVTSNLDIPERRNGDERRWHAHSISGGNDRTNERRMDIAKETLLSLPIRP